MNKAIVSTRQPQEKRKAPVSPRPERVRTKADIADLSLGQIRQMTREELITVINVADVPLLRGSVIEHLPYSDRDTLEKLAFLARRTVKNQGY